MEFYFIFNCLKIYWLIFFALFFIVSLRVVCVSVFHFPHMCAGHSISHVIFDLKRMVFSSFFGLFIHSIVCIRHHHHRHHRHNVIDSMNYLPLSCHLTNCNFHRKRAISNLKTLHSACKKRAILIDSTYIIFVFICQLIHKYKWMEKKKEQVFFLSLKINKNEPFICTMHIYWWQQREKL